MEITLSPPQWKIFNDPARFRVAICGRRFGKALALDTKIPTPDGFVLMRDIAIGDKVFDQNGSVCNVVNVTEALYNLDCFRVLFSDGQCVVACKDHMWLTWDKLARKKYKKNGLPKVRTTAEIYDSQKYGKKNETNHSVQTCLPIDGIKYDFLIDPYVLGCWLGDGVSVNQQFSCNDVEIINNIKNIGDPIKKLKSTYMYSFTDGVRSNAKKGAFVQRLKSLNLIGNKHIPHEYLWASFEQRLNLLQGLMDTDGTCSVKGHCEFTSVKKDFSNQVLQLCKSLGIKATLKEHNAKLNGVVVSKKYRICFSTNLPVFKLTRKLDRLNANTHLNKINHRYIVSVEKIESVPVKCIEVDSQQNLYLCTESFIPTHNSFLGRSELLIDAAQQNESNIWYVAPTYGQAKRLMWKPLKQIIPPQLIADKNETELRIDLINGSQISLKGADNYDSLRGDSLSKVVLDEFADIKQEAFEEVIRPALSDRMGSALFIGTPKGYNWAYDYYLKGLDKNENDWSSHSFTTLEGGNVPLEEIESAKRDLDPKIFAQEYEASFETLMGRVYYAFDRTENVTACKDNGGDLHIGMDFNVAPMSAVVGQKIVDQLHIIDEILLTDSNTIEMCHEIRRKYPDRDITVYPDPAGNARKTSAPVGQTDFSILKDFGFKVIAPSKHDPVVDRVNNTNRLLLDAQGTRRLFIDPKCKNVVKGFDGFTYKEGTSIPDKSLGLEHPLDAVGYMVMQLFPMIKKTMIVTKMRGV